MKYIAHLRNNIYQRFRANKHIKQHAPNKRKHNAKKQRQQKNIQQTDTMKNIKEMIKRQYTTHNKL